jgi:hypothetical protein
LCSTREPYQAWCSTGEPHQAVKFVWAARSLLRSEGEVLHCKTSLIQERVPLARRGACRREFLDASIPAGSSAGALSRCLFPPGCSPLMSFSSLLIGYTLGCNLGGGPWQAALDVIMS